MGLFHTKKIKLEKVVKKDEIQYYIDYYKKKEHVSFLKEILREFSGEKRILLVVDMEIFYDKKGSAAEEQITQIKKELDQHGISNREVLTKRESNNTILGIKIQKTDKVNSYQIGIAASPEQIPELTNILKYCNIFCYVPVTEMDSSHLLDKFYQVRGDYEELKEQFELNLYVDYYLQRIRICSLPGVSGMVEGILHRYN